MTEHPCQFCGARVAPFGYGWPGLRSALPENRRGRLWACAEHRADAEARMALAVGARVTNPDQRA